MRDLLFQPFCNVSLVMTEGLQRETRFVMRRNINVANHHARHREGVFRQLKQLNQFLWTQTNPANRHDPQPFRAGCCHHGTEGNTHVGCASHQALNALMRHLLLARQLHADFGFVHIQHKGDKHRGFGNPRLAARDL